MCIRDRREAGLNDVVLTGGRYGLGSKDTPPSSIFALFKELEMCIRDSCMAALAAGSKALHAKEIFFRVEFPNGSNQRVGKANPLFAALDGKAEVVGQRDEPVSYTHLDVYKRQDRKKAKERAHSREGLKKATDIVDELIATIRACKGGMAEAKACLLYTSRCV